MLEEYNLPKAGHQFKFVSELNVSNISIEARGIRIMVSVELLTLISIKLTVV